MSTKFPELLREVKVVAVGAAGVGKSCITLRFVNDLFKENIVATIGASFLTKKIQVNGMAIKFNIWDTAGQEKYRSLASLYYRGVDCALIVYDISNKSSFIDVRDYWMQELKYQCYGVGGLQMCIVGNKCDLDDKRQVTAEEGRNLAKEYNALFFESSAKTDCYVKEIFYELAKNLPIYDRSLSVMSEGHVVQLSVPERKTYCC